MHARVRTAALLCLAMTAAILPLQADAANSNSNANANSKVTICHATSSDTNPYTTITVSQSALSGHSGHSNDLIPAPAGGCPTSTTDNGSGNTDTGNGGSTDTNTDTGNGNGGGNEKTTICHSTSSQTNPYVKITVANSALKAHNNHSSDIIPMPATGCPGLTTPPPSMFKCTKDTPVVGWASGPNSVTLRSCTGVELRVWGDPYVTFTTRSSAASTFSVGFGAWGKILSNGTRVDWTTDPARRNAMSTLSFAPTNGPALTMKPFAYKAAADKGERRVAILPMKAAHLLELRAALLSCQGLTQQPIVCA